MGDSVDFDRLLDRADEETLQEILGAPTVRLLNLLDPKLATPSGLRELIRSTWTPQELLRNRRVRQALVSLLPAIDAQSIAVDLGLAGRQPFTELADYNPRKGSRQEAALFTALSVPEGEVQEYGGPPSSEVVRPSYSLFDHQRRAVADTLGLINGVQRRALLHMPTGSGKTRTAMHVVSQLLTDQALPLVVWLAYSEELCEQAAEEFIKAWSSLGDREMAVHRYWGVHEVDLTEIREGLVIMGLSKAHALLTRDDMPLLFLADRSCLTVIDEAHQAIAPSYRVILDLLVERNEGSRLLGLTATPGRTWNDPDSDQELADFFLRQKVSLAVDGYASPIDYLIDEGYLAKPHFRNLTYSGGATLKDADLRAIEQALDIPEALLQNLAKDEQRNLLILTEVERLAADHARILVFAASVEHAKVLASVLAARGHDAHAVVGTTPKNERIRVLTRFRSNEAESMILCNFGVLTTGFDAPRTSAAVIARPTKSLVLYSQMVGRAIRGTRAGGNREAVVVTIVDTRLPGFGQLDQGFNNWEDVW